MRKWILPLGKGKTRKCIGKRVVFAFYVMELNPILFEEETPTQDALCLEVLECVVLMVSVDMNVLTAIEHSSELFKSLHDTE
jgi:hypothetical protein